MQTEIQIGVFNTYQNVSEFTVNGVLNTNGNFSARNGTEYMLTLNKGIFVPMYAQEFKLKVIATDTCGDQEEKEVSLVHYTDILAQWSLDSVKDKIVVDSGGQNNNGVIHGSAELTKGIISNGFQFDGIDDYVSFPIDSFNKLGNWSFEAWVKPEGPGYIYSEGTPAVTLVIEMQDNNSIKIGTWHEGRELRWDWFNTEENVLKRNEWNHLLVTLANGDGAEDSGEVICYVNGVLIKAGALGSEYHSSTKKAALGGNIGVAGSQGLNPFHGCIDEVTLYGCVLSAEEVLKNYEKVLFLGNLSMLNGKDETSQLCTYGISTNNLDFELKKEVNKLVISLDLPSSIRIREIKNFYKKDDTDTYVSIDDSLVSVSEDGVITFSQHLAEGCYRVELLLTIDENLVIKSNYFNDESGSMINLEKEIFHYKYMDFATLPDVM